MVKPLAMAVVKYYVVPLAWDNHQFDVHPDAFTIVESSIVVQEIMREIPYLLSFMYTRTSINDIYQSIAS